MVCSRCLKVIKQELQELDITVLSLELGRLLVEAPNLNEAAITDNVTRVLHTNSFKIVENEECCLSWISSLTFSIFNLLNYHWI